MGQHDKLKTKRKTVCKVLSLAPAFLASVVILTTLAFAWLAMRRNLLSYAPVASPELLFIGAGHREFDAVNHKFTDNHFEDIRYLYFNGIDVDEEKEYYDYVFCVYGNMVAGYKLQLAYTTNNQFSYEIIPATESAVASVGATAYTTHTDPPATYYYTATGSPLAGRFLNARTVGTETVADASLHTDTYGDYSNVHKYGEPLYWQTTGVEPGYTQGDFINYYILRVRVNDKALNDRETDVICIAAKSF